MAKSLKERSGLYGKAKVRGFAALEGRGWVSSRELVLLAGLKYTTVAVLLPRWVGYGYVQRQICLYLGHGDYEYKLAPRGKGWLDAARRDLPAAKQFLDDMGRWQKYIKPELERLMAGPFNDVVAAMDRVGHHNM